MKMRRHRRRQAMASRLWMGRQILCFRTADELMDFLDEVRHGAR